MNVMATQWISLPIELVVTERLWVGPGVGSDVWGVRETV